MRILAVSLLALLPAAAGAADVKAPLKIDDSPEISVVVPRGVISPGGGANCPKTTNYYAYRGGKALTPQKLTELPPGNMYSAVYRRDVDGCEKPIVVKYGVGRR
jgi:hypothetical protein